MTRTITAFLSVLFFIPPNVSADERKPRDVSAELRTIVVQSGMPGLTAAIVDTHGLVAIGAAGVRRKGSPALIGVGDKMHLGSCTKAMTATVIARLVEADKLSWDSRPSESFADIWEDSKPGWIRVTLTQLLTHSAGAPHDLHDYGLWNKLWFHEGSPREQRIALVQGVFAHPPKGEPGTRYIYSNSGYAIAGAMAEQATGKDWETLMRELLFEPLGMTTAGFGAPGSTEKLDQPRGHTEDGDTVEPGRDADNPPSMAPAGTVHCSMEDWARFVKLHLDAEAGKLRLLTADSFRTLHTPANALKPAYAMGWGITEREWAGGKTLTHNGTNTMWFSAVWMAPLKGFAVMAACNQGGKKAEKAVDDAISTLILDHTGKR
ncbi:MAG: serine hydrolase domain-containing protein [Candidatus Hydrogenedentes bacterium]|nr:serine hydrolase domain-containing protein [Candidatus Hydrogenedentota bacterium]